MSGIYVSEEIRQEVKDLYDELQIFSQKLLRVTIKIQGINPDSPTPEDEARALELAREKGW